MMDTQMHEHISALADGELAASEVELAFAALDTPAGRAAWSVYHQIGHALRSDNCGADLSDDFGARMAARLAKEAPAPPPPPRGGHAVDEGRGDEGGGGGPAAVGVGSLP
ncbi:MAG TPA: transcriptional regulator [Janthinobacterium sp.]|nr:transcriptional regulator [Janthinobacterium sp.]